MHDFWLSRGHHLIDRDVGGGLLVLAEAGIGVLVDENAHTYWEHSDQFDMALDLTAGRIGLAKLVFGSGCCRYPDRRRLVAWSRSRRAEPVQRGRALSTELQGPRRG